MEGSDTSIPTSYARDVLSTALRIESGSEVGAFTINVKEDHPRQSHYDALFDVTLDDASKIVNDRGLGEYELTEGSGLTLDNLSNDGLLVYIESEKGKIGFFLAYEVWEKISSE